MAGVRAELGCAVVLVVIAPDRAVARWARSAIEIGHPGFVLRPVVVGPSKIPLVVDAQIARRHVELAVLSAMAHGHGPHAYEVGLAALRATAMLDEARRGDYSIFVLDALDDAVVLRLEAEMEEGKHRELTSLERHFIGKGIAKGIAEGRAEGEAKGRTEALQQSVLRVLSARGLEVPETVRDRVLACADADLLGEMLTRAATVDCADEVVS